MGYLLVLMIAVFGGIGSLLKKKYVEDTANVKASLEIYIFLSYLLAMLYFFVLAKGEDLYYCFYGSRSYGCTFFV